MKLKFSSAATFSFMFFHNINNDLRNNSWVSPFKKIFTLHQLPNQHQLHNKTFSAIQGKAIKALMKKSKFMRNNINIQHNLWEDQVCDSLTFPNTHLSLKHCTERPEQFSWLLKHLPQTVVILFLRMTDANPANMNEIRTRIDTRWGT